ncbi:MAG: DUF3592 domain-containing protein [Anaeroplasmataceae bacterium]|nr:DUF3592 domain-containing protein [Anaeroplasmataceae bacterium]
MILKENEKPKNHTIIHMFVMVLSIVMMGIFINNLVFAAKNYYINTHANYEKVYATIVRYEEVYANNGRRTYSTFYEYEDDGGVYYGLWHRLIKNEEEAKAQVGKKVPIYVDHTLKYHTTNLNFSSGAIWFAGAIAFASFAVFVNSFVRELIFIVRWKKYKKENQFN